MNRKLVVGFVVAGLMALVTAPLMAADTEEMEDVDAAIAELRKDIQMDVTDLITTSMGFTANEAAAFWPLYKEYQEKRTKIEDERVAIIKQYAEQIDDLSDEQAMQLVKRYAAYEDARLGAKRELVKKLEKVLPGKTVARYAMVQNRVDMVLDLELAADIPLVD